MCCNQPDSRIRGGAKLTLSKVQLLKKSLVYVICPEDPNQISTQKRDLHVLSYNKYSLNIRGPPTEMKVENYNFVSQFLRLETSLLMKNTSKKKSYKQHYTRVKVELI